MALLLRITNISHPNFHSSHISNLTMKLINLILFLSLSFFLQAQQYSYISDRRFFEPADMIGYDFRPSALEIPNETKMEIDPGEYSFGITFNYLGNLK